MRRIAGLRPSARPQRSSAASGSRTRSSPTSKRRLGLPELDHRARLHERPLDADPGDGGAVGRAEVGELVAARHHRDDAVVARHRGIRELEVVAVGGADRQLAALGDERPAEVGAAHHLDLDPPVGYLPTCAIEEHGPVARLGERAGSSRRTISGARRRTAGASHQVMARARRRRPATPAMFSRSPPSASGTSRATARPDVRRACLARDRRARGERARGRRVRRRSSAGGARARRLGPQLRQLQRQPRLVRGRHRPARRAHLGRDRRGHAEQRHRLRHPVRPGGRAHLRHPDRGITAVNFLSSSGSAAAAVGPDVQVERVGGLRARLAMGEEIVFPGHVYDGYLGVADVAFRLRRVDTLVLRSALWYEWPVFALESCNASAPPGSWSHHGFVSWAPMVRLPELPGEHLELRSDIVQAITTVPRAEYQDNPNVPAVVAAQTGALWFKFAFYASLPIALHGDPDLDFTSDTGATIANGPFLWRGALALGNASWVSLPLADDPAQHRFLSFFTKDGTAVAMFALARGAGASPSSLRLPSTWGGGVAAALELTDAERANPASLDSVQAQLAPVIGQQMAAEATHLGSGPSQYRAGLYAGNSSNNRRAFFYSRWRANAAAMRIDGLGSGRIASQLALEAALRDPATPIDWLAACESPLRGGMAAFEQPGNWLPPPPDAPVVTMTGDAAVPDAGDGGLDTMRDAAPDALSPDALDTFDATMPGLPDAADAPMPPDAGVDATPLDPTRPGPPDAGARCRRADADASDAARRRRGSRRRARRGRARGLTRWSPRMDALDVLRAVRRRRVSRRVTDPTRGSMPPMRCPRCFRKLAAGDGLSRSTAAVPIAEDQRARVGAAPGARRAGLEPARAARLGRSGRGVARARRRRRPEVDAAVKIAHVGRSRGARRRSRARPRRCDAIGAPATPTVPEPTAPPATVARTWR
jgi:hypothetical protein